MVIGFKKAVIGFTKVGQKNAPLIVAEKWRLGQKSGNWEQKSGNWGRKVVIGPEKW